MKIQTAGEFDVQLIPPPTPEQWFTVSSSGKDGMVMDFATQDGQTIQTTLWLSPNAFARSVDVLKTVFGFDGDFNALAKGKPLPNTKATIVCEEEDYKGKPVIKVRWINARGGASKATAADVPAVLERLARLSAPAPRTATQAAAELDDSELIPF